MVFYPPSTIYLVMGVLGIVAGLAVLAKKNKPKLGVVVVLVVVGFLMYYLSSIGKITVSPEGLTTGSNLTTWEHVSSIEAVDDLPNSDYGLARRVTGIDGFNMFHLGKYRLKNGETARVVLFNKESALVVHTIDSILLLAPKDYEPFINEVSKFAEIEER